MTTLLVVLALFFTSLGAVMYLLTNFTSEEMGAKELRGIHTFSVGNRFPHDPIHPPTPGKTAAEKKANNRRSYPETQLDEGSSEPLNYDAELGPRFEE